jgi:hypothetical protein
MWQNNHNTIRSDFPVCLTEVFPGMRQSRSTVLMQCRAALRGPDPPDALGKSFREPAGTDPGFMKKAAGTIPQPFPNQDNACIVQVSCRYHVSSVSVHARLQSGKSFSANENSYLFVPVTWNGPGTAFAPRGSPKKSVSRQYGEPSGFSKSCSVSNP